MKKLVSYKLSDVVLEELEGEAKRTGKTRTAVVEDALAFQRQIEEVARSVDAVAKKEVRVSIQEADENCDAVLDRIDTLEDSVMKPLARLDSWRADEEFRRFVRELP